MEPIGALQATEAQAGTSERPQPTVGEVKRMASGQATVEDPA